MAGRSPGAGCMGLEGRLESGAGAGNQVPICVEATSKVPDLRGAVRVKTPVVETVGTLDRACTVRRANSRASATGARSSGDDGAAVLDACGGENQAVRRFRAAANEPWSLRDGGG